MLVCVFLFGAVFSSCEKEENVTESNENITGDLKEPPFKNYMVISESTNLSKSVENSLKTSGAIIVSSIPEIGISIVSSKGANFIENTTKKKNITAVVPDYEIAWIPTSKGIEANLPEATPSIGSTEPYYFNDYLWGLEAIDAPEAYAPHQTHIAK